MLRLHLPLFILHRTLDWASTLHLTQELIVSPTTAQYLEHQYLLNALVLLARQVFSPLAETKKKTNQQLTVAAGGLISGTKSQGSHWSWANKLP